MSISNRHKLAFFDCKNTNRPLSDNIYFITKPGMFFRSVELDNFMKSWILFGMASPRIIDASDFAIRKVYFNSDKCRLFDI